jgi:hypothetical protein
MVEIPPALLRKTSTKSIRMHLFIYLKNSPTSLPFTLTNHRQLCPFYLYALVWQRIIITHVDIKCMASRHQQNVSKIFKCVYMWQEIKTKNGENGEPAKIVLWKVGFVYLFRIILLIYSFRNGPCALAESPFVNFLPPMKNMPSKENVKIVFMSIFVVPVRLFLIGLSFIIYLFMYFLSRFPNGRQFCRCQCNYCCLRGRGRHQSEEAHA